MLKLTPYLVPTLLLTALILGSLYVSKRFVWSLGSGKTIFFFIGFFAFTILSFVGLFLCLNKTDTLSHVVYIISAFSMGLALYFLCSTLLADFIHLLIKFPPKYFNYLTISLSFILFFGGYLYSKKIHITEQTIQIIGLPKPIKAVHLTDIHIGHFRSNPEYLNEIIEKTNAQNPDIIFFTGDYLDAVIALDDKFFSPLTRLNAPLFFVEGNHDVSTNAPAILRKAKRFGAKVLMNQMTDWNGIQIIGLNHMVADENSFSPHTSAEKSTIKKVLNQLAPNKEKPTILLHHSPDGIEYANKHGIDLYLTGHTHGGQLFPITILANYMFAYNKGLDHFKNTKIYVSQGIGTFGPPIRIGTKSEIVILHLTPSN
ncbi:hypothetical protein C7377_1499 [Balneicella halophila]|uniref:Calcineurin-like phosphoesterase domain-containing protein n=1 Tax=Balneicella halophila TaxID=1537566 RepID=A0A7L4UML5_BALHA|nr:metallophosphoesterase [Balneicella halophila]PVX49861.1 hypothetical protein C7377_1499 [Balneicella halophila]